MPGTTLLITGAAGDIGRAVAVRAAAQGAGLVLADRPGSESGLADTRAACLSARESITCSTVSFDVTDEGSVAEAFGALRADGAVANALFNNAGYQGVFANTADYPVVDFRHVMEVNVTGAFTVLRTWAATLIDQGGPGVVVNSASMAHVGAANMPAYSASKAAIIGLTRSAAKDLAPHGIRVNAVSPAFIGPGAMWDRQIEMQAATPSVYYSDDPEAVAEEMINQIPLRRLGTLDEVASVVTFLLSEESSYLTGVNLEIAGGVG